MTLVEDGLFCLNEPVSRYLPELKSLMVLTEHTDGSGKVTTMLASPLIMSRRFRT